MIRFLSKPHDLRPAPQSLQARSMFVIVRHGNTFEAGEQPRRIGARTNLPLTQEGMAQAGALGRHFMARGWQFSRMLVSPLLRARQTAAAIQDALPVPIAMEAAEFLREIDHGPDENLDDASIVDRIGKAALLAWDREGIPPPGWIVNKDCRIAAWRSLFADRINEEGPVLLVTSNGAARFALLAHAQLWADAACLPGVKLPTGGYGVIRRGTEGRLNIDGWGLRP